MVEYETLREGDNGRYYREVRLVHQHLRDVPWRAPLKERIGGPLRVTEDVDEVIRLYEAPLTMLAHNVELIEHPEGGLLLFVK